MGSDRTGYALAPGEGEGIWFLGTRMTVKAGDRQTAGAFTLIEQEAPAGFGPPPHVHLAEDEAFYVLAGELAVSCGGATWVATPGSFVFLPRGLPHSFTVAAAGPARLLQLTSPAGFERFAAEVGEPVGAAMPPPSAPPDVPRLLELMAKYGYEPARATEPR